jgi:hypothetical protein
MAGLDQKPKRLDLHIPRKLTNSVCELAALLGRESFASAEHGLLHWADRAGGRQRPVLEIRADCVHRARASARERGMLHRAISEWLWVHLDGNVHQAHLG